MVKSRMFKTIEVLAQQEGGKFCFRVFLNVTVKIRILKRSWFLVL